MNYGNYTYKLSVWELKDLQYLYPWRPVLSACMNWVWIYLLVKLTLAEPILYPITVFFIAGRAGSFLQLAHEAAHHLVSQGSFNNWFGSWMACYPIGLDLKGYADTHLTHHICVNQHCDPASDSEKYRVCKMNNPKLWLLFLKDALGITALKVRAYYSRSKVQYFGISVWQLLILWLVFEFNPVHYVLLWLVPLTTAHMVLMRVRGIGEHGSGVQVGADLEEPNVGTYYTRSFGTSEKSYGVPLLNWIERSLIGSLDVYYHHEHHLFPSVPYYNLHKLHEIIKGQVKESNQLVYVKGYFSCLWK